MALWCKTTVLFHWRGPDDPLHLYQCEFIQEFVCTSAVKQTQVLLVYPPSAAVWTERCHCLWGRRVIVCVYDQTEKNSWDQRSRKNQSYREAAVLIRACITAGCSPHGPGEWKWFSMTHNLGFSWSYVYLSGEEIQICISFDYIRSK